MGAFYPVLGAMELTAEFGYTTRGGEPSEKRPAYAKRAYNGATGYPQHLTVNRWNSELTYGDFGELCHGICHGEALISTTLLRLPFSRGSSV
jgi:hypothetical protein